MALPGLVFPPGEDASVAKNWVDWETHCHKKVWKFDVVYRLLNYISSRKGIVVSGLFWRGSFPFRLGRVWRVTVRPESVPPCPSHHNKESRSPYLSLSGKENYFPNKTSIYSNGHKCEVASVLSPKTSEVMPDSPALSATVDTANAGTIVYDPYHTSAWRGTSSSSVAAGSVRSSMV